jgi:hypothetical protein
LLRVEGEKDLPVFTLASGGKLAETDEIVAFGCPFGQLLSPDPREDIRRRECKRHCETDPCFTVFSAPGPKPKKRKTPPIPFMPCVPPSTKVAISPRIRPAGRPDHGQITAASSGECR